MASVYKRGNSWRGQVIIGSERISVTCRTRKEVMNKIAEIQADYNRGEYVFKDDITVEEWCQIWLEAKQEKIQEQSFIRLSGLFRNHLYPFIGNMKLQDLTRDIIEEAYVKSFAKKNGREYAKETVTALSYQFKMCLQKAVNDGLLAKNPHLGVELHKFRAPTKIHAYSKANHQKIVEYTKSHGRKYHIFYLLIATGMRVGEACALSWSDVDLSEGLINIHKTAVSLHGSMMIQDHPKTEQSDRTIYLSPNTVSWLKQIKKESTEYNFHDLVMPTSRGTVQSPANLRKYWRRACAEMGIPYYGIHALRHTWATRALESGIDIKTVSGMLGHKNIITTMNIYQEVLADQKKEAAKKLDGLF